MLLPAIFQVTFQFDKLYIKQGTNEGTHGNISMLLH